VIVLTAHTHTHTSVYIELYAWLAVLTFREAAHIIRRRREWNGREGSNRSDKDYTKTVLFSWHGVFFVCAHVIIAISRYINERFLFFFSYFSITYYIYPRVYIHTFYYYTQWAHTIRMYIYIYILYNTPSIYTGGTRWSFEFNISFVSNTLEYYDTYSRIIDVPIHIFDFVNNYRIIPTRSIYYNICTRNTFIYHNACHYKSLGRYLHWVYNTSFCL